MVHQVFNSIGANIYNGVIYTDTMHIDYHFHNSFELTYIISGTPTAIINNTSISLRQGDFLLIAPNIAHKIKSSPDCSIYIGVFSADFIPEFYEKGMTSIFYKFRTNNTIEQFLSDHFFYAESPDFYMLKSCLYMACSFALSSSEMEGDTTINATFTLAVNNYIAKNLNTDFSRKDIAKALNYEEHYFSTLFNNNFKISFTRYVNAFRFDIAQRLISSTKLNISDIAYKCGFKSIQSFNRIFKEFSGKTPSEYRNSKMSVTVLDVKKKKTADIVEAVLNPKEL